MAGLHHEYDEAEWEASAGHRPLQCIHVNQIANLHGQWIWANYQRSRCRSLLPESKSPSEDPAFLASEVFAAMYLWYALLWTVVEAFGDRAIELRGPLAADIGLVGDTLRRCRNGVFHIHKTKHHDDRLFGLMFLEDSPLTIGRISTGLGRLFIEESHARNV